MAKQIPELQLPEDCLIAGILRKKDLAVPHGKTVIQAADMVTSPK